MTLRRWLALALLAIGIAGLARLGPQGVMNVPGTGLVAGLCGVGIALSIVALARRSLSLRVWVRVIAMLFGTALFVAILLLRRSIAVSTIGPAADANSAFRLTLLTWQINLTWLAAATAYATCALAVLPGRGNGAPGSGVPAGASPEAAAVSGPQQSESNEESSDAKHSV
jgi:hypothetical protein